MQEKMKYDVLVVGGGTAGCAAAYTAGKLGFKTLLVEKNVHLGGTITSGLVIPAMKSSDNQINTDFFNDLISELQALKGQITYLNNPGWFNPELTKIALDRLMAKASVETLFDTTIKSISLNNRLITEVELVSNLLSVYIDATYVIDSTGNCEISELANCEFLDFDKKFQPVSLRFEMSGINIETFAKWIYDYDKNRDVTTVEVIDGQTHLSTAYTWDNEKNWALAPLFENGVENGVITAEDASYFQVFTIPNAPMSLAFNCPRIHFDSEIDPLNPIQISKALVKGRESIIRLSNLCKEYFPGFENSYISNIADALGVRVSRRIRGKYVYSEQDLKSSKKFANPILVGNYPIDVHSNTKGESVLEHTSADYQLPVEALMSNDIDNLFVVGRGISAEFKAQAALRIQPSCFSMGEGLIKWIKDHHQA